MSRARWVALLAVGLGQGGWAADKARDPAIVRVEATELLVSGVPIHGGPALRSQRACYDKAVAKAGSELTGKVAVKFTIGPAGDVVGASVASSSAANAGLEDCLVRQVKGWIFPKPRGGGVVSVTFPFVFASK